MAARSDHCGVAEDRGSERARFHAALIGLCPEKGYEELTVAALCRRAGLEPSTFERDRFFAYLERSLVGSSCWVDRLRAVAYALLRYLRSDVARTQVLTIELYRAGEPATRIWSERIAQRLCDLIGEGRRELDDRIFAGIHGAVGSGGALPPEGEVVPGMMYAAVLPYLGTAAASAKPEIPSPAESAPPPVLVPGAATSLRSVDAI